MAKELTKEEQVGKNRTPSGSDFQFAFKQIRNIFSPEKVEEESLCEQTGNLSDSQVKVGPPLTLDKRRHSTGTRTSSIVQTVKNRATARAFTRVKDQCKQSDQSDSDTDAFHTPPATPKRIINKAKRLRRTKTPKHSAIQKSVNQYFKTSKENTMDKTANQDEVAAEPPITDADSGARCESSMETDVKTTDSDITSEKELLAFAAEAQTKIPDAEIPEVLHIRTVMKMFKTLQQQKPSEQSQEWKTEIDKFMTEDCKKNDERIVLLKEELQWSRKKERIMARTVQRLQDITTELAQRVENLEINNAKRCIVISGLYVSGKKDAVIRQIENFLFADVGVPVLIEDTYTINQYSPPSRVVVLMNQKDKHKIMQNKSNLNGLQNENQQPIYINDYQTSATNEKRKWEKEVRQFNDNLPSEKQKDVKFVAGNLVLDGEMQCNKVIPPGPEDILDLSEVELDKILRIRVLSGPKIEQESSEFKAYTIAVSTHQEVQEAYSKVRWVHAAARHIVCAYYLPDHQSPFEQQGYCDDGESGAGRRLLNMLVQSQVGSRAVFVVRYYGGTRLGVDRFQCYEHALKGAIQQHPFNSVLKVEQKIDLPTKKAAIQPGTPTQPQHNDSRELREVNRGRGQQGRGQTMNRRFSQVVSASARRGNMRYANSYPRRSLRGGAFRGRSGGAGGTTRYEQYMTNQTPHKPHPKRRRYSSSNDGTPAGLFDYEGLQKYHEKLKSLVQEWDDEKNSDKQSVNSEEGVD